MILDQQPPDSDHVLDGILNQHEPHRQSSDFNEQCFYACQVVAHLSGTDLKKPLVDGASCRQLDTYLNAVAVKNNLRLRTTDLSEGWQHYDCGSFIILYDSRPCAMVYQRNKGYVLVDPQTTIRHKLTDNIKNKLTGQACFFAPALPEEPLSTRQLPGFLFSPFRKDLLRIVFFQVLLSCLLLGIPLFTGYFIDSIIPQANQTYLMQGSLLFGSVLLTIIFMKLGQALLFLQVQIKAKYRIKVALWDKLLRLPMTFFHQFTAGDLHFRTTVFELIQDKLNTGAIQIIASSLLAILNVLILFFINATIALPVLVLLLVMLTIGWYITSRVRGEQRQVVNQKIKMNTSLLNLINTIVKIRVSHEENSIFHWWRTYFSEKMAHGHRAIQYQNTLLLFNLGWMSLSILTVYGLVIWQGAAMSFGHFIIFNASFTQLFAAMQLLLVTLADSIEIVPLLHKIKPIMDTPVEKKEPEPDDSIFDGSIVFHHVLFRYSLSGKPVLLDFNLDIKPRSFVALVGASGSGKSTLLRLLLKFGELESGSITYNGIDLNHIDAHYLRSHIGAVLQSTKIIPGTIYENIAGRNRDLSREEAWELARHMRLEDMIRDMPMGMDTLISDGIQTLSGGEIQRLNLARALSSKPNVLLLDEATSALDNSIQYDIHHYLQSLSVTRVVVAHRISTVRHADVIHVIEHGRCVESGTYDELMKAGGAFFRLANRA